MRKGPTGSLRYQCESIRYRCNQNWQMTSLSLILSNPLSIYTIYIDQGPTLVDQESSKPPDSYMSMNTMNTEWTTAYVYECKVNRAPHLFSSAHLSSYCQQLSVSELATEESDNRFQHLLYTMENLVFSLLYLNTKYWNLPSKSLRKMHLHAWAKYSRMNIHKLNFK